jgi:hypothetical protein
LRDKVNTLDIIIKDKVLIGVEEPIDKGTSLKLKYYKLFRKLGLRLVSYSSGFIAIAFFYK